MYLDYEILILLALYILEYNSTVDTFRIYSCIIIQI